MERSELAGTLRNRGFQVVRPLKGTSHCSIFCVQENDDPSEECYVAKVVSLNGLDAKGRASAHQEVSLLKGLAANPNLIAYRESFLEDSNGAGILFIVMSLAEDGDLRRVVTESQACQRMLPEPLVLSWTRQTLAGLCHLHAQGVVHRDLKSSNIFLCDARRRIRIGDFGISRVLESTAFASSCVGTPAYMSPELMRNERYDYHVDMWALGCIVYELCTLTLPFQASSLLDLVFQVVETDPDWSRWGDYSEELRDVAYRLLDKDTSRRPTSQQIIGEPLFAPGGRGAMDPTDDVWAIVAPEPVPSVGSPEKRRSGDSTPSQLTTADTGAKSSSAMSSNGAVSSGSWSETPLSDQLPASADFQRELQANRMAQRELSRDEFQTMMSTYHDELRNQIKTAAAGMPAAVEPPVHRQVPETVI